MLNLLPYAAAALGGYKGYRASRDAGGSGLQRILAGLTGATAGYYGGKLIPGVEEAGFIPFTQIPAVQALGQNFPAFAGTTAGTTAAGAAIPYDPTGMDIARGTYAQQYNRLNLPDAVAVGSTVMGGGNNNRTPDGGGMRSIFDALLRRKRLNPVTGADTGEMQFSPGKVAAALGIGTYLGGAFDPKPVDVYTPTYNLAVAELQRQRGGFKYIDPETGVEKVFDQPYIPEADPRNKGDLQIGPYAVTRQRLKEGGLAEIKKYNTGGVNYLPSKRTHNEDDVHNYVRATGYVEDGSGTGDKNEDTMLAQLADGEFVTRADGVLGAGIIAGASPNSIKDMKEKGAEYFYEQQRRYKRVFDLLQRGKNAQAKTN